MSLFKVGTTTIVEVMMYYCSQKVNCMMGRQLTLGFPNQFLISVSIQGFNFNLYPTLIEII